MEYIICSGLIVLVVLGTTLWFLKHDPKQVKIFKQYRRHTWPIWIISLLLGLTAFFIRQSLSISAGWIAFFLIIGYLIMGCYHYNYLIQKKRLDWLAALPYLSFITATSMAIIFASAWLVEVPFFRLREGVADNLSLISIFGLLPFSIAWAHHHWTEIPVIKQELIPWDFPTAVPQLLENGNCAITFKVPSQPGVGVQQVLPIRVMPHYRLGQVFHRAVYEYNIINRAPRPIEIAKNNRRSATYQWHFYLLNGADGQRRYIDPEASLEQLGLKRGGTIYVHRANQA